MTVPAAAARPAELRGGGCYWVSMTEEIIRKRFSRWLLILSGWTAVGIVFAGSIYLTYSDREQPITWKRSLFWGLAIFYMWALLSPPVIWLARRFPLDGRRFLLALGLHLPACLAVCAAHALLYVALQVQFDDPPVEGAYGSFASLLHFNFYAFMGIRIMTYAAIVLATHALDYYRKFREGELRSSLLKAQLAEAQLQALKMQLHPHFLFNTLNAIAELIFKDPSKAERVLMQLSDILRLSLVSLGVQEITLRQELEFLEKYLEIEKTRLGERLTVSLDVPADTLGAYVPSMILQPLVENAIRHGIAPRGRGGRIKIHASREDGMLLLNVSDDGQGAPVEALSRVEEDGGVGLSNTRARLQHLYGPDHRFELCASPGAGVTVKMAFPFRETWRGRQA